MYFCKIGKEAELKEPLCCLCGMTSAFPKEVPPFFLKMGYTSDFSPELQVVIPWCKITCSVRQNQNACLNSAYNLEKKSFYMKSRLNLICS